MEGDLTEIQAQQSQEMILAHYKSSQHLRLGFMQRNRRDRQIVRIRKTWQPDGA